MPLKQLTPDQICNMSLQEKDLWWFENVYRGNVPQLNFRSAITGMLLGGLLSLTNLYVGIRIGWTLGVGITSVILSYTIFRVISRLKLGKEMTLLENNAMQSIATSAGYMTGPLVSSLPAYMVFNQQIISMWQAFFWMCGLSILGVLIAFPLKRRYINEDQSPFPEGYAAGVVLDNLHSTKGDESLFKSKLLIYGMTLSACIELLRSKDIMSWLKAPFLALPEYWDQFIYKFYTPSILGTPLKDLTIRMESSIVMMGTGGLMDMKTSMSLMLGAIINYVFLAPYLIQKGIIASATFKNITMWSLWFGASIMTTSSLYSFFSKPKILLASFKKVMPSKKLKLHPKKDALSKNIQSEDILKDIELPMSVFAMGIPLVGAWVVWMAYSWFGVDIWLGIVAIPLVFIFSIIGITSTALTSITPTGALAKLTQVSYSVLSPGNISTNLATAGMTSEIVGNASNLLNDIKPGYMLGGKPRQQAVGHVLGIFAGGLVAVPLFYYLFHGDISLFTSETLPMPSVSIWTAVAEVLSTGISSLHPTARGAVLIGALLGVVIEFFNQKTEGKLPISGVGLGLAFVLRFSDSLMMSLGTLFFWFMRRTAKDKNAWVYKSFVENQETFAAGVIAGGALIGILIMFIEQNL